MCKDANKHSKNGKRVTNQDRKAKAGYGQEMGNQLSHDFRKPVRTNSQEMDEIKSHIY